MLENLNERIKDRDVSLGVVMIVAGISVWFVPKLAAVGLVIYGLVQTFWKKEDKVQVEEHHHHHHHNNNKSRKKAPRKKNG